MDGVNPSTLYVEIWRLAFSFLEESRAAESDDETQRLTAEAAVPPLKMIHRVASRKCQQIFVVLGKLPRAWTFVFNPTSPTLFPDADVGLCGERGWFAAELRWPGSGRRCRDTKLFAWPNWAVARRRKAYCFWNAIFSHNFPSSRSADPLRVGFNTAFLAVHQKREVSLAKGNLVIDSD